MAAAGDAGAAQAAAHAVRARSLAAEAAATDGLHAQLVGGLIETCADDTVRLTGAAGSRVPLSGGT